MARTFEEIARDAAKILGEVPVLILDPVACKANEEEACLDYIRAIYPWRAKAELLLREMADAGLYDANLIGGAE